MKKTISILCFAFFLLINANSSFAASVSTEPVPVTAMTDAEKTARLEEIQSRVAEIKSMDKSSLSKAERKDLRKELRAMNKEAKEMKGGVYLSVGAIIIIILVLILIL